MDKLLQQELIDLIAQNASTDGVNLTPIAGVTCFRASSTDTPIPSVHVYEPSLCVIVQGRKQLMLEDEVYHYGATDYLITTVDLPVIGKVIEASPDKPYLCLKIDIDQQQLSELLIHTGQTASLNNTNKRGVFVGKTGQLMGESVLRLARLLDMPEDIPVLAAQMLREVYYRVLRGEYGDTVAQISQHGSQMQRIATVVQKLKTDFREQISVETLAELAGMSLSSFHAHFKAVTAMSPLQFQKRLRLMEARRIMLGDAADASSAAYHVGYESPSQFSREYSRMFGNPPRRDINLLREQGYTLEV